jgi:photosystem II stability/assembly factor-like uncharacterized protein
MKNIKFLFLIISLILNFSLKTNAQWTTQKSGVTVDLYDVCFVDSLHGWIVGDSVTILATTDGGENWVKQYSSDSIKRDFLGFKIKFINRLKGFCGGDNGMLLSTIDGGNTWKKNNLNTEDDISDIELINENTTWVTTISHSRESKILKTTDFGNSWETQLVGSDENGLQGMLFTALEFQDSLTGWFMCGDYHDNFAGVSFYKTTNSGQTWTFDGEFEHGPLYKLKVVDTDTLWAGGNGWFTVSNDAGKTWDEQQMDPSNNNRCFAPINGNEGWICQSNFTEQRNEIYYTNDGRTTWSQDYLPEKSILEMTTVGKNYLWAVGSDGNIIKRYGVPTSIQDIENVLENYYLSQNYPNPFNPSTKISYSIPKTELVELKVFDTQGKEVVVLVDQEQQIGNYEILFNASKLSSGVYFLRFKSGGFVKTKKMILLR